MKRSKNKKKYTNQETIIYQINTKINANRIQTADYCFTVSIYFSQIAMKILDLGKYRLYCSASKDLLFVEQDLSRVQQFQVFAIVRGVFFAVFRKLSRFGRQEVHFESHR